MGILVIGLLEEQVYSYFRRNHFDTGFLSRRYLNLLHSGYQEDLLEIPHTGKDRRIKEQLILI
jgi:hypothetical protein